MLCSLPSRFNLNNQAKNEMFFFKIKANSHLFFVCPNHAIWSDMGNKSPHYGRMYENLLLVDEHGYKDCSMSKRRDKKLNREIFRCDQNPQKFTYTEEIFSSQRAFSRKMKYEPGKNYSFICKYIYIQGHPACFKIARGGTQLGVDNDAEALSELGVDEPSPSPNPP